MLEGVADPNNNNNTVTDLDVGPSVWDLNGSIELFGVITGNNTFSKIIGVSWKEGIVRLEVDK